MFSKIGLVIKSDPSPIISPFTFCHKTLPVPVAFKIALSPSLMVTLFVVGLATASFTITVTCWDCPSPHSLVVVKLYTPLSDTSIDGVVWPLDQIYSSALKLDAVKVVISPLHRLTSSGDRIAIS